MDPYTYPSQQDEWMPQAPMVITHPVYDNCSEDRFKLSREKNMYTTLFGNGSFGPLSNIFHGDMLFVHSGAMRDQDQTPPVFSNLESVVLTGNPTDISEKRRELYRTIQFVGIATSDIKYDPERSVPFPNNLAVQVGGGIQIRHSGAFSLGGQEVLCWFAPTRVDPLSNRALPDLRSINPGNTREFAETFDFSDIIHTESFRNMAKLQMMMGIWMGRNIGGAMNAGRAPTEGERRAMVDQMTNMLTAEGEHFGDEHLSNYMDYMLDSVMEELKEKDGKQNTLQNRFMETMIPFAANTLSVIFSRMVATSSDYVAKGNEFFGFLNAMAVRTFTEKFM